MVALPLLSVAEPRDLDPEVNVTVPVGVVVPDAGLTVAVSTVEALCAIVGGFAASVVVVPVTTGDTLTVVVPVEPVNVDDPP